jgi:hypothetical protein
MAKYQVANVEFGENTTAVNLTKFPPNSTLVIASDANGNIKILELDPNKPENKDMVARTAGLCYRKLPSGSWQWVPC